LLPIVAFALLLFARVIYQHWAPPFFIDIALPLILALAVIRLLVFALRRLYGATGWLPASERVIAFSIWGFVLLYFTGVLPQLRSELMDVEIPIGKQALPVYELLRGIVAVVLTLAVTLWLSGLIERRLMQAATLDVSLRAVSSKFIRALLMVAGVLFA